MQQALAFSRLPACRFFDEGAVYYVQSPAARVGYYYCRSGNWQLIPTASGSTGPTGVRGPTGAEGPRGPVGVPGATGAMGANGATGPRGVTGVTGPAGGGAGSGQLIRVTMTGSCRLIEIGIDDNRNGQLEAGEVDSSGQVCDGPTGAVGAAGSTGARGATGAVGPIGAPGIPGATGATGARGATGATGSPGATGPAGSMGPTGSVGLTGSAGPIGSAGATGSRGPTGPTGATGPTGPRGATGPTRPLSATGDGGQCLFCAQARCATQYDNALGRNSDAANRASVTELLDCVIGPNFELGGPIPQSSCFFADPAFPGGTLLPCYCGSTPEEVCLANGPSDSSQACGAEIERASRCNPVVASCVGSIAGGTPLSEVVQLLNCERAACGAECGIPSPDGPPAICGNGILEDGEACDLGAANGGPNCTTSCQLPRSICGDGVVGFDEQCDLGAANGGPLCTAQCFFPAPVCGDGIQQVGEDCDLGPANGTPECTSQCLHLPSCGNGTVDSNEDCDLGAANGGPNCTRECRFPNRGDCLDCVQQACPTQYDTALGGGNGTPQLAGASELLQCITGSNPALDLFIPPQSCYFWDTSRQPRGSLVGCYCANTPTNTCFSTGPADPSAACAEEVNLASGCNPAVSSCVVAAGNTPSTGLRAVLQLLDCERNMCSFSCGFQGIED